MVQTLADYNMNNDQTRNENNYHKKVRCERNYAAGFLETASPTFGRYDDTQTGAKNIGFPEIVHSPFDVFYYSSAYS